MPSNLIFQPGLTLFREAGKLPGAVELARLPAGMRSRKPWRDSSTFLVYGKKKNNPKERNWGFIRQGYINHQLAFS